MSVDLNQTTPSKVAVNAGGPAAPSSSPRLLADFFGSSPAAMMQNIVYNAAGTWVLRQFNLEQAIFSPGDSNLVFSLKNALLIEGIEGTGRVVRQVLAQSGFNLPGFL